MPSSEDVLARVELDEPGDERREQALLFLLYLTALEHVAAHAEELESALERVAVSPGSVGVDALRELHQSRWYTFVLRDLLSVSEVSIESMCSSLSSKEAHDAVIALLVRYRGLAEAIADLDLFGFPDPPSATEGDVADLVQAYVDRHHDRLAVDDLGGVRSLARAERLLAASQLTPELLGYDEPSQMVVAAQMHADLERFSRWPEPSRIGLPWDDATRDALRLPVLLLTLGAEGDPHQVRGPFGRLSAGTAAALSSVMRRLRDELGPDELPSPFVHRRTPTEDELQRFFEEAIQQSYAAGLKAVPESAFLTDRLSELAACVVRGSDVQSELADLIPRLREARLAWVLELGDRDFAAVISRLDEEDAALAARLRRRYGVLLEEIEPARRRERGRLRSWTRVSARDWFDPEVGIPQLHVRVLSGSVPILDTVDDLDDIVRLGAALIRRSLDSLDGAREPRSDFHPGAMINPGVMTQITQDLRELVARIEETLPSVRVGSGSAGSTTRP